MWGWGKSGNGNAAELEEKKKKALEEMRKLHPEDNDSTLGRFLRARDHKVDLSSNMLKAEKAWRATNAHVVPPEAVAAQLAKGKAYFHKRDKRGSPLIYILPAKHFPNDFPVQDTLKCALFMLEKAIESMPPGVETFSVVIDFEGFAMANNDLPFCREAIAILQNYYPERLGRVLLVAPPFIFRAIWAIIKPLLQEATRNKILFLGSNEELKQYIDPDAIPEHYGGTSTYVYDPAGPEPYGLIDPPSQPAPNAPPSPAPSPSAPHREPWEEGK
jgi:hypothetical protein